VYFSNGIFISAPRDNRAAAEAASGSQNFLMQLLKKAFSTSAYSLTHNAEAVAEQAAGGICGTLLILQTYRRGAGSLAASYYKILISSRAATISWWGGPPGRPPRTQEKPDQEIRRGRGRSAPHLVAAMLLCGAGIQAGHAGITADVFPAVHNFTIHQNPFKSPQNPPKSAQNC
jgi:hypothetical protein